jgi:MscS family membrane protein
MTFLGLSATDWKEVGLAAAILAGAIVLARLLLLLLDRGAVRLSRRTRTSFDDGLLDAVRLPVACLLIVIGIQVALARLSFLSSEGWHAARGHLLFILYLAIVYLFLYKLFSNMLRWYSREIARRTESAIDEQVLPFVRRVVLILLSVIALIVLLGHFEVDVSAFVTTLGIGSLALALAAQAALGDTVSGFAIIADRPFAIGDRIEILELDTWGDVLDIGLRSTRIRTRDNRMVVVPNSVIGKSLVVNHSIPSTVYRVETHVGIAYGSDVDYARQVMIEAVRAQDWVMHDERIEALFIQYGDSALVFRVRCWIEDYVETRRIMDKLNTCLYQALQEADIEIGSPTQMLYHRVERDHPESLVTALREARLADQAWQKGEV